MMILMRGRICLISFASSSPSFPGMRMSRKATSNSCSCAALGLSLPCPLVLCPHPAPSFSGSRARSWSADTSSSTISIFIFVLLFWSAALYALKGHLSSLWIGILILTTVSFHPRSQAIRRTSVTKRFLPKLDRPMCALSASLDFSVDIPMSGVELLHIVDLLRLISQLQPVDDQFRPAAHLCFFRKSHTVIPPPQHAPKAMCDNLRSSPFPFRSRFP